MGSTPYADNGGGVTFRVWAPNATSVSVRGSFNGWGQTSLVEEGTSGIWSADVSAASAGDQYKYFIDGSRWERDPRGRQVVNSIDNTIVYDPNAFDWEGDTRLSVNPSDLVIYEMHVGAFYDPSPLNGLPGNFYNAITKLDYLQEMGFNAVELLPIWEFPGDYSWGYNPSDPFTVENTAYGGPDGLKNFVKEAHARGIHVFMDVVHNHYGPGDLDMYDFDTGSGPGIYFYSAAGICCTPWGSRPDYSNEGVRSYIIDNFKMWMDEYNIDGFRWDAVGAMRRYDPGYVAIPEADTLIQYINNVEINANRPGVYSVAEDQAFGMGFDGEWDHGFGSTLINQAVQSSDANRDMNALWSEISGSSLFNIIFAETHDLVGNLNGPSNQRLPKRIHSTDPDSYWARKRSMLAGAVIMTTPGVPMLFMGQEMLEDEQFGDGNPLDWNHVNNYPGVVNFFRDMTHLRRNLDGVSLGLTGPNVTQQHLNNSAKVLAYHRWGAGTDDQVMVIMNWSATSFGSYNLNFPENGTWYVNLNSDSTTYGSDFSNVGGSVIQVAGNQGTVGIGPYSVLVLSRQAHPEMDHDNDGLLSGWEQAHFGDPLVAVPTNDDDLDGADNAHEQTADTIPTQTASVLKMLSVERSGDNLTLEWQGGEDVTQVVQQASSLTGPWTDIHTNNPPTAITNSIMMTAPTGEAYFRVQAGP
jgi:1,4-alpha-glucan branching enzyme